MSKAFPIAIGYRVRKNFAEIEIEDGWVYTDGCWVGTVTSIDKNTGFAKIVYSDGDVEEMDIDDLKKNWYPRIGELSGGERIMVYYPEVNVEYPGTVRAFPDPPFHGVHFDCGDELGFYDDSISIPDLLNTHRFLLYPESGGLPEETQLYGKKLVGRSVAVYLPGAGERYRARVLGHTEGGKYRLRFDHHEEVDEIEIECVLWGTVARLIDENLATF